MSYDIYKEFDNYCFNSGSSSSPTKGSEGQGEIAYESIQGLPIINKNEVNSYFDDLDKMLPINVVRIDGRRMYSIGMEADDPFADIGNDDAAFGDDSGGGGMDAGDAFASGNDDPFGSGSTSGGQSEGDSSDPFGGIGDDSGGGDDPFGGMGDDGSGEQQQQNAKKKIKLDREKTIKEDYNISRQIRQNFPKKFLMLKDIISNNINIIERTVVTDSRFEQILMKMVKEYENIVQIINTYLDVIPRKTYEDIFGTYVSVHSAMMRLKQMYMKLTNYDDPETMSDLKEYNYDTEAIDDEVDPDNTSE